MASFSNKICCPSHSSSELIEDHVVHMICPECGLVIGDRVNSDSNGVDPKQCGDPLKTITNLDTGAASIDEFGATKYQNDQTISSVDRSLILPFNMISKMASYINLPTAIVDRAKCLFKQLKDKKCLKGRPNEAMASACIYIACRQEGAPRTIKEIWELSNISKKTLGRYFKLCLKALDISVDTISTADFMSRFCSNLKLPIEIECAATHIAEKALDIDIVPGFWPISVAAAAIYMASQASEHKRSKKEISVIAGVTHETIRKTYKVLFPYACNLFPENFIFTTPIESLPLT